MEFIRMQEERPDCVKMQTIEDIVNNSLVDKLPLLVCDGYRVFKTTRATTTNQNVILFVGECVGGVVSGAIQLVRTYEDSFEARHLVKIVVKNGKSVYVTDGTKVYDTSAVTVGHDNIILFSGSLVGHQRYDNKEIERRKNNGNSHGEAWFNYN